MSDLKTQIIPPRYFHTSSTKVVDQNGTAKHDSWNLLSNNKKRYKKWRPRPILLQLQIKLLRDLPRWLHQKWIWRVYSLMSPKIQSVLPNHLQFASVKLIKICQVEMETEKTLKNGKGKIVINGRLIRTTKGNHKDHKSNFFETLYFLAPLLLSRYIYSLQNFKEHRAAAEGRHHVPRDALWWHPQTWCQNEGIEHIEPSKPGLWLVDPDRSWFWTFRSFSCSISCCFKRPLFIWDRYSVTSDHLIDFTCWVWY